jgi:hypothetical protein
MDGRRGAEIALDGRREAIGGLGVDPRIATSDPGPEAG